MLVLQETCSYYSLKGESSFGFRMKAMKIRAHVLSCWLHDSQPHHLTEMHLISSKFEDLTLGLHESLMLHRMTKGFGGIKGRQVHLGSFTDPDSAAL